MPKRMSGGAVNCPGPLLLRLRVILVLGSAGLSPRVVAWTNYVVCLYIYTYLNFENLSVTTRGWSSLTSDLRGRNTRQAPRDGRSSDERTGRCGGGP